MRTSEVLLKAKKIIAGGWRATVSNEAAGKFCLLDACLKAANDDLVVMHAAMRAMGHQTELRDGMKLGDWEAAEKRTANDVLQLIDRAARHAEAQEAA